MQLDWPKSMFEEPRPAMIRAVRSCWAVAGAPGKTTILKVATNYPRIPCMNKHIVLSTQYGHHHTKLRSLIQIHDVLWAGVLRTLLGNVALCHIVYDLCHTVCGIILWLMAYGTCCLRYRARFMWQLAYELRHMIYDTWHIVHDMIYGKIRYAIIAFRTIRADVRADVRTPRRSVRTSRPQTSRALPGMKNPVTQPTRPPPDICTRLHAGD